MYDFELCRVHVKAFVVLSQGRQRSSSCNSRVLEFEPKSRGYDGEPAADSGPGTCGLPELLPAFLPHRTKAIEGMLKCSEKLL